MKVLITTENSTLTNYIGTVDEEEEMPEGLYVINFEGVNGSFIFAADELEFIH